MFLQLLKENILSLKKFILISCLLFFIFALYGFYFAKNEPLATEIILEEMTGLLGPILEMPALSQFLFILLNNGFTLFLVVVLGLAFGIFPFLVLLSNGFILGMVAYTFKTSSSWPLFFLGILPHGIIEIPVLILAAALGLKLGRILFLKIFSEKEESIKKELNIALILFLKFLLPLLALAAAIEVFITARLL